MKSLPLDYDALVSALERGLEPDLLFFWGHTGSESGRVGRECLSQWYPSSFTMESDEYATAEHWMMAEKARLFRDGAALSRILASRDPREAKALGRAVRGFDGEAWEAHRLSIVVAGNRAKFGQNPALKQYLLDTGDQVLVEASPYDRIWGIGLSADAAGAKVPQRWRGLNLLGFTLMAVRDELRTATGRY
jgi:ribA/ribD-fused uncharacterized protein